MNSSKTARILASAGIALALAGCETIAEETTEAIGYEYTAMLAPMAAGGIGSGKAEISLNDATNTLCSDLELSNNVRMAGGSVLGPGGVVIAALDVPNDDNTDNDANDSQECDGITGAQIDAIRANPGAFTVHIDATTGDLHGPLIKE